MKNVRVIPRLDIKGPNLVKGVQMEGLRVVGKPEDFAKHYYQQSADELIYMDVVASLYGRNSLLDIIEKTSKEIFIPLTVGGGLRTLNDVQRVLYAGADKVSINTGVINRPELITEVAKEFGSSTIVVSIEVINLGGHYEAYINHGRDETGVDPFEWAKKAEDLGAGELLITSIDRDGTGDGYDVELIQKISESVSIPVIAAGGAGCVGDVLEVIKKGGADAVSMASILHYQYIFENKTTREFLDEGNTRFLEEKRKFSRIQGVGLPQIKNHLHLNNVDCRFYEKQRSIN
jgi:cyclase